MIRIKSKVNGFENPFSRPQHVTFHRKSSQVHRAIWNSGTFDHLELMGSFISCSLSASTSHHISRDITLRKTYFRVWNVVVKSSLVMNFETFHALSKLSTNTLIIGPGFPVFGYASTLLQQNLNNTVTCDFPSLKWSVKSSQSF